MKKVIYTEEMIKLNNEIATYNDIERPNWYLSELEHLQLSFLKTQLANLFRHATEDLK